jgi:hypothetical protein
MAEKYVAKAVSAWVHIIHLCHYSGSSSAFKAAHALSKQKGHGSWLMSFIELSTPLDPLWSLGCMKMGIYLVIPNENYIILLLKYYILSNDYSTNLAKFYQELPD